MGGKLSRIDAIVRGKIANRCGLCRLEYCSRDPTGALSIDVIEISPFESRPRLDIASVARGGAVLDFETGRGDVSGVVREILIFAVVLFVIAEGQIPIVPFLITIVVIIVTYIDIFGVATERISNTVVATLP